MNTPRNQNAFLGAGIIAADLAAAGGEMSSMRRTLGAEGHNVRQLLRSGRLPPRLQAVQASLDRELCEWLSPQNQNGGRWARKSQAVGSRPGHGLVCHRWREPSGTACKGWHCGGRGCAWFVMPPAILCSSPPMATVGHKENLPEPAVIFTRDIFRHASGAERSQKGNSKKLPLMKNQRFNACRMSGDCSLSGGTLPLATLATARSCLPNLVITESRSRTCVRPRFFPPPRL